MADGQGVPGDMADGLHDELLTTLAPVPQFAGHWDMLQDRRRNQAYAGALRAAVARVRSFQPPTESVVVLEVGTGSGLLSGLAARAGADRVVGAEVVPELAAVAAKVYAANGHNTAEAGRTKEQQEQLEGNKNCTAAPAAAEAATSTAAAAGSATVTVRQGHSMEIEASLLEACGKKADIFVAELLDTGLLGEGLLSCTRHAADKLCAKPGGVGPSGDSSGGAGCIFIPSKAHVYVAAVECLHMRRMAALAPELGGGGGGVSGCETCSSAGVAQMNVGPLVLSGACRCLSHDWSALSRPNVPGADGPLPDSFPGPDVLGTRVHTFDLAHLPPPAAAGGFSRMGPGCGSAAVGPEQDAEQDAATAQQSSCSRPAAAIFTDQEDGSQPSSCRLRMDFPSSTSSSSGGNSRSSSSGGGGSGGTATVDALVVWWRCEMGCSSLSEVLSTEPGLSPPPDHWRQAVYLQPPSSCVVEQGDELVFDMHHDEDDIFVSRPEVVSGPGASVKRRRLLRDPESVHSSGAGGGPDGKRLVQQQLLPSPSHSSPPHHPPPPGVGVGVPQPCTCGLHGVIDRDRMHMLNDSDRSTTLRSSLASALLQIQLPPPADGDADDDDDDDDAVVVVAPPTVGSSHRGVMAPPTVGAPLCIMVSDGFAMPLWCAQVCPSASVLSVSSSAESREYAERAFAAESAAAASAAAPAAAGLGGVGEEGHPRIASGCLWRSNDAELTDADSSTFDGLLDSLSHFRRQSAARAAGTPASPLLICGEPWFDGLCHEWALEHFMQWWAAVDATRAFLRTSGWEQSLLSVAVHPSQCTVMAALCECTAVFEANKPAAEVEGVAMQPAMDLFFEESSEPIASVPLWQHYYRYLSKPSPILCIGPGAAVASDVHHRTVEDGVPSRRTVLTTEGFSGTVNCLVMWVEIRTGPEDTAVLSTAPEIAPYWRQGVRTLRAPIATATEGPPLQFTVASQIPEGSGMFCVSLTKFT